MSTGSDRALSIVKIGLFMIVNAMIVHEALISSGAVKGVKPLSQIDPKDPVGWLIDEWNKILNTNYRMVFEPAIKLLKSLPSHSTLASILIKLSGVARKAVVNRAIFKHDLAGRLYHTLLLREVAKGLATYYTSIPAATILASLALDYVDVDWGNVEDIGRLRVVDYACGSGTLLSAIYTEVMDRHIVHAKNRPSIPQLHKLLLEKVLCGFDVLEYAIHLASTSLVLRDPTQAVADTNTYIVPIGVVDGRVYLGSLNLEVYGDEVRFPSTRTLTGGVLQPVVKGGVDTAKGTQLKIEKPHVVIMNPPFARTGNVGKSSLFGHLPRAERDEVLEELRRLGEKIVERHGLDRGFGRAGLAAYFVMKAYEASRDDGVLAFVLPRVFLSGSDWSSIRSFLARRGGLRYVIVSDDPRAYWAWSENTNLSEILLVYRKGLTNSRDGATTVVYVRERPRSALEAKVYAQIMKSVAGNLKLNQGSQFSGTHTVKTDNKVVMYIYKVSGEAVRDVAKTNLNIVMGFHSSLLNEIGYELYTSRRFLGYRLPLIPLKDYIRKYVKCPERKWEDCVGYDVANIRRKCLGKGSRSILYLNALNRNTFSSLKIPQNALDKAYVPDSCVKRAGRLLIAGVARLGLTTIGVVTSYYNDPVLSQVAWSIPLGWEEAKIQTLWLNTTPGLIHFLSMRQDSAGGFVQLKKNSLGELLLLDTDKLSEDIKSGLVQLFDRFSETRLGNIYTQLENASNYAGYRFELDTGFIQALKAYISEDEKRKLKEIYDELLEETILKP